MPFLSVISEHGALSLKSFSFLFYVMIFVIIFFLLQKTKFQKWFLLVADLFFMFVMSGFQGLLISVIVCAIVYITAINVSKYRKVNKSKATLFFYIGIVSDLGALLFFKYFKVAYESINKIINSSSDITMLNILAPIGLSYFSLSIAAYLLDVKHGKIKPETNFFDFLSYTLYFPAIIEGPFNLYKNLAPQLKENHFFNTHNLQLGCERILWGYFLKNVIADRVGILVNAILKDESAVGLTIFMAMFFYSFQLYADFAGGINVIMGISEILGISLPENFKSPFVSKSITEYWQRWHMSLGTIMEKYVYYPLVLGKTMRNLSKKIKNDYFSKVFAATAANFLVFILVGIWHGTGWNYVVYGLYQAFFTSMAILCKPVYVKLKSICHINENSLTWNIFTIARTITLLIFGRLLIKASDLHEAGRFIRRMFSSFNPYILFDGTLSAYMDNLREYYLVLIGVLVLFTADILCDRGFKFRNWLNSKDFIFRYSVYILVFFVIIILGVYGENTPYIYAQY